MPIQGADKVIALFGRWPSFHDAEVARVVLERERGEPPTAHVLIHTAETTSAADPARSISVGQECWIELAFGGLAALQLEEFNQQNVLFALEVEELTEPAIESERFKVRFSSSYGMGAEFRCATVHVVRVEPATTRIGRAEA